MIEKIILNINESSLNFISKKKLISYAKKINSNHCPVIFDKKQLSLMFELDETEDIKKYVEKESHRYTIQKRNGALREVVQPSYKLKQIQKWLLKHILMSIDIPENVHGFLKGKSILTNAQVHIYDQPFWVYCLDIKDFFPSIKQNKVKNIFTQLGYSEEVSNMLSDFCTIDGKLVQGFPSSPMISNIIFKSIDEDILNITKKLGFRFSRYADDLSFSGLEKSNYKNKILKLNKSIGFILNKNDFYLNIAKTRIMKNKQTKKITGLIVNENGVKVPKKYIKIMKKEIYYSKKYGVSDHLKHNNLITIANYKGYLIGLARFIYMVEQDVGSEFLKEINELNFN